MSVFLDCLCDENYKALIIEGKATETELREAWIMLLSEYYDLRGDMDGMDQWRLSRDITRIQNHLYLVDKCVDFLKTRFSESICQSLNSMGYFFFPENKTPGMYTNELIALVNQSKTKYIELKQLIKQQEDRLKKVHKEKPKREHYDKLLVEIEYMQHTTYDIDKMFVSKFIILERKYWELIEKRESNGK